MWFKKKKKKKAGEGDTIGRNSMKIYWIKCTTVFISPVFDIAMTQFGFWEGGITTEELPTRSYCKIFALEWFSAEPNAGGRGGPPREVLHLRMSEIFSFVIMFAGKGSWRVWSRGKGGLQHFLTTPLLSRLWGCRRHHPSTRCICAWDVSVGE